jgi:hypothetical protein
LSLRTELIRLFGINTWRQAKRLQPGEVNASAVHRAAGALLSVKSNPAQQVEVARAMCPETAAALCRWMAEPAFWAAVAGVTRQ